MVEDVEKLGHTEIILKCGGEPAMKNAQAEVKEGEASRPSSIIRCPEISRPAGQQSAQ